ncbi:molybdopterin biosynthesis protein [Cymbomonas tetramitiformis]|uniref:Molybdopterin biosynthesis protein n=1 Tax=Cymbomonas tetramitiformis TaxID=36881 RepID=A0AAE0GPI9_9CHLO|nr:molybdopterin biosynthesis protein [Cymbomonas tetramitiformis]
MDPKTLPGSEKSYDYVSVAAANSAVQKHCKALPAVSIPLQDALHRVLAETVVASHPFPPFRASIKDGYAIRAADGPGIRKIIGNAWAGPACGFTVTTGTAAYITTGGALPEGADAVVGVEQTQLLEEGKKVLISVEIRPGAEIRPIGADIPQDEVVVEAGQRIGASDIGILATIGKKTVRVHQTPEVWVISTGNELKDETQVVASDFRDGQICDCNRPMLIAAARAEGANVTDGGIVTDSEAGLLQALRSAITGGADVIVTSGGVSMGDRDYVKPVFESLSSSFGGAVHFGRVLMKPGKPFTFATLHIPVQLHAPSMGGRTVLLFGLPGNPVSALVTSQLICLPALRTLSGLVSPMLRRVWVTTEQDLPMDPVRPEYHRARVQWDRSSGLGGSLLARSTGNQISSRLLSMKGADVLMEVPQGSGKIPKGSQVSALLINGLEHMEQLYTPEVPTPILPNGVPWTAGGMSTTVSSPSSAPAVVSALPEAVKVQCEAFAFSKLVQHLQLRTDVQNIDQMTLAGFCRNCLAKWYAAGAHAQGLDLPYDTACEMVYGMPYKSWKSQYQTPSTPEQLAQYEANKHLFAKHPESSKANLSVPLLSTTASTLPEAIKVQCEAFAFSKLVQHLQIRSDVQNMDQMILAGFCRNCLAKWYAAGARAQGLDLPYDLACEQVYGMPYKNWKSQYQTPSTPEKMAKYEANKQYFAKHDEAVDSSLVAISARVVSVPSTGAVNAAAGLGLHSDVCSSNAGLADTTPKVASLPSPAVSLGSRVPLRASILTVSDRASAGAYPDLSGPEVVRCLHNFNESQGQPWNLSILTMKVVPDELETIQEILAEWASPSHQCNVVITTGGTGFSRRDVTPEATQPLLQRTAHGVMTMVQQECSKVEPMAALSRGVAGVCNQTFMVNLPGRPKAVQESLMVLMPMLTRIVQDIND